MQRIINAYFNSWSAFRHLLAHEKAFQQELVVLLISLPLAFMLSQDGLVRIMLVGAVILVMIVEVLNTAVEAACDALSRDFNDQIKIAKDCGSLAVLLSILIAASVWGLTAWRVLTS